MSSPPPTDDATAPERSVSASVKRRRRFLAALLVLLVASVVIRVVMPKPAPAPVIKHYTPQEAKAAEQSIAALQKQLLAPAQPAPRESPARRTGETRTPNRPPATQSQREVSLQLSEADLNAYVATDPHVHSILARKGVRSVQILLREPRNVVLRAGILYKGHAANLQVAGTLLPSAQTMMRLNVSSARVGRVPIPARTVTAEIDALLPKAAGPLNHRLPLVVSDVRVAGHSLILTGARP